MFAGSTLHIVVACADRKRAAAGTPLRLREVRASSLAERCNAWWEKLARTTGSIPARDLYVGDHWTVARSLPDLARSKGFAPRLWVASAGYGLVPGETPLAPYSATFVPGSPDSVTTGFEASPDASSVWWAELASRSLPGGTSPRTLRSLAETPHGGARLLILASPAYVRALQRDLSDVAAMGAPRAPLILVTSAPGPSAPELRASWVPIVANLRMSLGGALPSLHARVARRLLEQFSPDSFNAESAREYIRELAARSPEAPIHKRDRNDDEQVRAYIRRAVSADPNATHTRLLKEYRSSGRACEQKRFRNLFAQEVAGT